MPACGTAAHEAAYHGVPQTTLDACGGRVSLLLQQVDQYDAAANAALVGIRAEPVQPELPRLRSAAAVAEQVVLLAEEQDVRGEVVSGRRLVKGKG